jgi:ABC-type oligopeptide transport system substrate-binding subunit
VKKFSFVPLLLLLLALPCAAAEQEAKKDAKQYINDYLVADPSTMDVTLRADTYSSSVMRNVMEGLVRLEEKDGQYNLVPSGSTGWETSPDGLVWTFHLRPSKWEDGVPVTAQQYVYGIRRAADPKTGSPNSFFLEPLKNFDKVNKGEADLSELGVRAVDDMTLELTLKAPTPMFLSMINETVYFPLREDKISEWSEKYGSEAQYFIANGPFRIESWTHNNSMVLVKNNAYWDAEHVNLEKINIFIMSDETTYYNAFLSGELDFVTAGQKEWVQRFKETDAQYAPYSTATISYAFYNAKDKLFKNVNVRKAFTLAVDREDINEMCFGGLRIPTYGWVVPTISVGNTNYRKAAGDIIREMSDQLKAEGKTPKDLLLQGMKELGLGDDPSKLEVTFSLAGTSEWFRTLGEYLQQVYKTELGVDLKISYAEWGIFYDNVLKGNYQIGFMGWGAYYNDPYDVLSLFVSSYDAIKTGWSSSRYDELLKHASTELDESVRLKDYIDAENILIRDECVVSPMATARSNRFIKPWVHGYATLGFSGIGYKYVYTSGR